MYTFTTRASPSFWFWGPPRLALRSSACFFRTKPGPSPLRRTSRRFSFQMQSQLIWEACVICDGWVSAAAFGNCTNMTILVFQAEQLDYETFEYEITHVPMRRTSLQLRQPLPRRFFTQSKLHFEPSIYVKLLIFCLSAVLRHQHENKALKNKRLPCFPLA